MNSNVDTRFHYQAATADGRVTDGVLDAASREAALGELRRRELFVIALDDAAPKPSAPRGSGATSLALWTRTLATMLGAGVRLDEALAFGADQAAPTALGTAVRGVRAAVRGGASLAAAMRAHPKLFDPLYVAMVAAGEEGGALPPVLARLADHLEERAELRSQLRASLLYPALLTVVSGVGVTVLLLFVLPRFAEMLADVGGTLPTSTRLLLGASRLLVGWWWLWLALLVVLGIAARRYAGSVAWHARRLTWPLVGELERAWATARLTRTLGILLGSGVPVLPSLRIARASVGNAAIARAVERAESAVANGARVADALAEALPPLAQRLLAVGEESGRLAELCSSVAASYDGEVRRTTRALVGMVEPALVLLFGAVVGWIALAMLQAIYSVNARSF
jgi:type II secretory pathway component PulF